MHISRDKFEIIKEDLGSIRKKTRCIKKQVSAENVYINSVLCLNAGLLSVLLAGSINAGGFGKKSRSIQRISETSE